MKTCPVCQARSFDDAEVCYGCLHRFSETEVPDPTSASASNQTETPAPTSAAVLNQTESPSATPVAALNQTEQTLGQTDASPDQTQETPGSSVVTVPLSARMGHVSSPRAESTSPVMHDGFFLLATLSCDQESGTIRLELPWPIAKGANPADCSTQATATLPS